MANSVRRMEEKMMKEWDEKYAEGADDVDMLDAPLQTDSGRNGMATP
jgi:hypothetical protein